MKQAEMCAHTARDRRFVRKMEYKADQAKLSYLPTSSGKTIFIGQLEIVCYIYGQAK